MRTPSPRVALIAGFAVLAVACGDDSLRRIPIGPVPVAGAHVEDVWGITRVEDGRHVFHRRTAGEWVTVPTPPALEVVPGWIQVHSAGEGAVWVMAVFGEGEFVVGKLHAGGGYDALDVGPLQAAAGGLTATRSRMFAGGETVYVATDHGLFRRSGETFSAVDGVPAAFDYFGVVGVAGAHFWGVVRESETQAVAHRHDGAEWRSFPFTTQPGERLSLSFSSEGGMWLGLRHFDGSTFAPPADASLALSYGIALPGGALEVVHAEPQGFSDEGNVEVALRAQRVGPTGKGQVRLLETMDTGCSKCGGAPAVSLADGSLVFAHPNAGAAVLLDAQSL